MNEKINAINNRTKKEESFMLVTNGLDLLSRQVYRYGADSKMYPVKITSFKEMKRPGPTKFRVGWQYGMYEFGKETGENIASLRFFINEY